MIEVINTATACISILAAGYIHAKLHMRMRVFTSGALLASGILLLHAPSDAVHFITPLVHLAIVGSTVYFATIANDFICMSRRVTKSVTARHEDKNDFPPHDCPYREVTTNVIRK